MRKTKNSLRVGNNNKFVFIFPRIVDSRSSVVLVGLKFIFTYFVGLTVESRSNLFGLTNFEFRKVKFANWSKSNGLTFEQFSIALTAFIFVWILHLFAITADTNAWNMRLLDSNYHSSDANMVNFIFLKLGNRPVSIDFYGKKQL